MKMWFLNSKSPAIINLNCKILWNLGTKMVGDFWAKDFRRKIVCLTIGSSENFHL